MARIVYEKFQTVPVSDFYDELKFEFQTKQHQQLPEQLFAHYLIKTAVDMAEKGNILRRRVDIELEPCVTTYSLASPDNLRLWAILGVRLHEHCGERLPPRYFDAPVGSHCSRRGVWYDEFEQELHIETSCNSADSAIVTVAVVPERDVCELPAIYKTRYYSLLLMGTRANIMLITGRDWTNLRLGAELYNEYNKMLRDVAVTAHTSLIRGSVKMNFGKVM